MKCEKAIERILSRGSETSASDPELSNHISGCRSCSRAGAVWGALRGAPMTPSREIPSSIEFFVLSEARRIAAETHRRSQTHTRIRKVSFACAAACVVFFLVAAAAVFIRDSAPGSEFLAEPLRHNFTYFGNSLSLAGGGPGLCAPDNAKIMNLSDSVTELNAELELISAMMFTFSEDPDLESYDTRVNSILIKSITLAGGN